VTVCIDHSGHQQQVATLDNPIGPLALD